MLSDDLVKRLRHGDPFERAILAEKAADRIEWLEAKLAKAVEVLTFYSCKGNCDCLPGYEADPLCGWNAHVALAAIKENDNG